MSLELMQALLDGDLERAETLSGCIFPEGVIFNRTALTLRIHQLQENPRLLPWLMHSIVIRASRIVCGRVGFHSMPGPEYLETIAAGGVEMGYEVDPRFRRHGYAKEAAIALMKWAFNTHRQRSFVLSISPTNAASLAMAASLGFQESGSQMDDEDGLELIFVRRLTEWPAEWTS